MRSGAGCPSRPSRSFSLRHTIMITSAASSASPPRRLRLGVERQERRRPRFSPRLVGGAGAPEVPGSATATALAMPLATAPRTPRPGRSGRRAGAPAATPRVAATAQLAAMMARSPVVAGPPATPRRADWRAPAPDCLGRARGSPLPRATSQVMTGATALRPPATAPRQAAVTAARATVEPPLPPPSPRPRPRPPRRRPTPRPGPRRPPLFAQCPPMPAVAPPAGSSACGTARDRRDTHARVRVL